MSYLKDLAIKRRIDPSADLSVLQGILVKEEQREKGHVKLDVWKTFIQACGGKRFWIYLILVLVAGEAIEALRSYWIKLWVAASANSNSRAGYGTVMVISSQHHSSVYWLGVFTLFGLLSVAWSVLQRYLMFTGRMQMVRKMHRDLIRRVVHAEPSFFVSTPIGRIINCFSRDMSVIDDRALELIGRWLGEIVGVLTTYFVITAAIPAFIIVAVFTTGIFVLIGFYYLNAFRELKRLESNSMSPLLSLFGEMIQGATTIRAFGIKHYYIKEAINRITAHNQPFYGVWTANRWLHLYVNVVSATIASTATAFIYSNLDWIDAGMAGFILSYAIVFCDDMLWVVRNYSDNETNMNAIERIMQYMNIEQEAALDTEPEHRPLASWPTKGDVQIDNLFAEYVPGVPVLHDVSLSIEHGEKVGIVGRTGSGKTTISLALLRFVEASKGRIMLDGVDISKIGLEDLRRNVTIIPQDPVLFNGSIRFNLDPFDEHPDSFLWEALRRTHLVKDDDSSSINTETDGSGTNNSALEIKRMAGIFTSLDNEIKENGHNLSAGQRQLVALARALVRRSRLIVMDEATASVDFDTDSRIQTTIRGPEFANSTLLCIAHRLRTIIDYDRVLVLDDGRVAEFDTPHNLLQKKGGIFKSLCEESSEYEHMKDAAAASRN
ncbi:hypothetical protein H4S06_000041 [Coemansia sp. BCRC 34490]|nr:hypothetical protein H4S06_000041 [Coemansia sp. BCRC 34490]